MKTLTYMAFCLIIMFCGWATSVVRTQNNTILTLADRYSSALRKFQTQKKRVSVEDVLRKGKAVAEKLDELESLNEADYSLLEKKMRGFVVNREEVVFIKPDSRFFARLSKTHGTKADISFFALMRDIRPDNVWAAYVEQQTDYSGCTIYGNGSLTRLYVKALQFKRTYPKSYVSDIDEEIGKILDEFTDGICACGNRNGVLKEFRLFIKTFPKDKMTPLIKKNLANIVKRVDFRFNCLSG